VEQSTSRGRSQGNQTGMGLSERHGAGNSMALHVPGIQTEAFPKVIQGRIWNSVLMRVGQMGKSNGMEMGPTLSGGTGASGGQGRGPQPAPKHSTGDTTRAHTTIITIANLEANMTIPQHSKAATRDKRRKLCVNVITRDRPLSRKVPLTSEWIQPTDLLGEPHIRSRGSPV
jgi:hypothetical protein